jgi:hypothetical protein
MRQEAIVRQRQACSVRILLIASTSLASEMLMAADVHFQPGVPAAVLPLGIKPPLIPHFVLLRGVMVAIPAWQHGLAAPGVSSRE